MIEYLLYGAGGALLIVLTVGRISLSVTGCRQRTARIMEETVMALLMTLVFAGGLLIIWSY